MNVTIPFTRVGGSGHSAVSKILTKKWSYTQIKKCNFSVYAKDKDACMIDLELCLTVV